MDEQVQKYIAAIPDKSRRDDMHTMIAVISDSSGHVPAMWGSSIISFGTYHYKYDSGREGDAPIIGLSNRKQAIVVYGLGITDPANAELLKSLGKYKTGKGCVYITNIDDIDLAVLTQLIRRAYSRQ